MPNYNIGILGGGQLGRMLYQASIPYNVQLSFLDKADSPIQKNTPNFTIGSIQSFTDVVKFGELNEVVSIEIENINTDGLKLLQKRGVITIPSAEVIKLIKDKGLQKEFYISQQLPTSPYKSFDTLKELKASIEKGQIEYPFVQKLRIGGYDGRGVEIIRNDEDIAKAFKENFIVEELADIDKELALIIARDLEGNIVLYPTVEMIFNEKVNIVEFVSAPAKINKEQDKELQAIATKLVKKLNVYGILAIEFFLNKDGTIWINECAPRTHNSGHWTIEGSHCSQFEQHLRILHGLPLGQTEMTCRAAIMFNLLGDENHSGQVDYSQILDAYSHPDTHVHLYGKHTTKPFRKMGHVTMTGNNQKELLSKAQELKNRLKIISL